MSGSLVAIMVASVSGGSVVSAASFAAGNSLARTVSGSGTKSAGVTFKPDGTVAWPVTTVQDGTDGSLAWFSPTGGSPGNAYYLRYTATSGSFTSNPASSFTNLNGALTATVSGTTVGSATFTIDIATDAGGTNIVFTKTGNVLAFDSAPA